VWANNGLLTLNQDLSGLADFDECTYTIPIFGCFQLAIYWMVYAPYFVNNEDYITIHIFDGQDGHCLVYDEHLKYGNKVSGIRKGCFVV
jgi:hypothetical protein